MHSSPTLGTLEVPESLRQLEGWLVWKFEDNGKAKPRKVPYYTNGVRRHGVHGGPKDRANLSTFDIAKATAIKQGYNGVGLAILEDFGLVALDFDNCVDSDGQLHPTVQQIASESYAEFSPSGKGVRAFFHGNLGNRKDPHSEPFGLETFSTKGFVTVTGDVLPIVELVGNTDFIAPLTSSVNDLCLERFGNHPPKGAVTTENKPVGLTRGQIEEALSVLPDDQSYDDWLKVGMALHHEFSGSDDGFNMWDDWSQASPKYTTREYNWERWVSFGHYTERQATARSLVRMANEHGAHIILDGPASMDEFEDLGNGPERTDTGGADDTGFADISGQPQETVAKKQRFDKVQLGKFAKGAHPGWIIKNVLPKGELAVLFGESGSGKSFAILDMVAAIARGVPWRGHKVKQGRVAYIAAEGAGGFRKRAIAYGARQGIDIDDIDFFVIPDAPNLLLREDALAIAKSLGPCSVIVIDTLAQTTPGGNENAGEDMGKALAHCKGIARATGAMVILVHHSGKDASKGARGWSGLRAACDAEFEVLRLPGGRILRTSKQKDGDDGAAWGFELDVVDVGVDEDGDPITSCVIKETEVNLAKATSAKPLGENEKAVVMAIAEISEFQTAGIEVSEVIKLAVSKIAGPTDGKRDTRKQKVRRALETLSSGDTSSYYWDKDDDTLSIV